MSSRPMLGLLKVTLNNCLVRGTKAHQSGITASTEKNAGETILVFFIDCNEGRRNLNMEAEGVQICDFLYCYARNDNDREIICFLEFKGRNVEEAVSQIFETRKYVEALAKEKIGSKYQRTNLKACICFNGTTPRGGQKAKDDLKRKFGNDNVCFKHGPRHDIGQFLRK